MTKQEQEIIDLLTGEGEIEYEADDVWLSSEHQDPMRCLNTIIIHDIRHRRKPKEEQIINILGLPDIELNIDDKRVYMINGIRFHGCFLNDLTKTFPLNTKFKIVERGEYLVIHDCTMDEPEV